jgi:hypothetical protein
MTAPERMWAPTSEPFSITQTETSRPPSAASWRSRIAAARPAGPAPTITTSNSMDSRSIVPSPWCGVAIRGAYISVEPI